MSADAGRYQREQVEVLTVVTYEIDYRDGERDWVLDQAIQSHSPEVSGAHVDHGGYRFRRLSSRPAVERVLPYEEPDDARSQTP